MCVCNVKHFTFDVRKVNQFDFLNEKGTCNGKSKNFKRDFGGHNTKVKN